MNDLEADYSQDKQNDSRTSQELIELALVAEDEDALWNIVSVLQFRGDYEVFEIASRLCDSHNPNERKLGVDILGQLGIPNRSFPDESLRILFRLIEKDENTDVLSAVGIALGHIKDARAIKPLTILKDHPSADVRFGVVLGLLGQEDSLAINTLIELSSAPDEEVRNWAVFGLGSQIKKNTKAIRDALLKRLNEEKNKTDVEMEIRGEALLGLAIRKDERVVKILIEELSSQSVGILAVEAAREIGDSRLCSVLMHLKDWWDVNSHLLEEAIHSCCTS
ncbi:hypothetical protein [Allocoleopsis sp.]|uniref:hypothetical protein n=1 Tax=Allocoleopsis sp. TaxID=3088169 RepID=UPI002FD14B4F